VSAITLLYLASSCARSTKGQELSSAELASRVANTVANRENFRVTPSNVRERFNSLAPLTAETKSDQLWRFESPNPPPTIAWLIVDFQPSESDPQQWQFLQLRMVIKSPDLDDEHLRRLLRKSLSRTLGEAKRDGDPNKGGREYWSLSPYQEVSLREGQFDSPHGDQRRVGVLVEMSVLQGEAEE
jgi:hypothetical protein